MIRYDKDLNLCIFSKVLDEDMGPRIDALQDVRRSFNTFVTESAMKIIDEVINDFLKNVLESNERFTFWYKKIPGFSHDTTDYTAIYGRLSQYHPEVQVFVLPYMDSLGKVHFYSSTEKVKVIVNHLVSSDDISYDAVKKMLSLVLAKKSVRFMSMASMISIEGVDGKKQSFADVIDAIQSISSDKVVLPDVIRNPTLQRSLMNITGNPLTFAVSALDRDSKLITNLTSNPEFSISKVRESFNQVVSLDRAIGARLSRKVSIYEVGTYVTAGVLERVKSEGINCIYVKSTVPAPDKRISGGIGRQGAMVTVIDAGTVVTEYLREYLLDDYYPQYSDCDVLPETLLTYDAGSDFSFIGKYATKSVLEFLESVGFDGVLLGENQVPWYFETEVISNYSFRRCDLDPSNSSQEWVMYKNGVLSTEFSEYLTVDDLVALYSTIGYLRVFNTNIFMDKDRDFLQNVAMADELFSHALTLALKEHLRIYRNPIKDYVTLRNVNSSKNFLIFCQTSKRFLSKLNEKGYVDTCDTTNIVAELSQVTHVCKRVVEAPDSMRMIAIPYIGRICPFETPEGKQLGLVNNKSVSCRIVDGEMLSAVRRVYVEGDYITISDIVEDLSVREQMKVRVSDVMELVQSDIPGKYLNTRITAIVPNPENRGEKLVMASIMAEDLDYVFAYPEGFVSLTCSMIPFATSDDAVRVSFGSKMIKSSIYLLDPDEPCVQTSMYRDIFRSTDAYLLRAEKSGTVISIQHDNIVLMYDGDSDETVYNIREFKVTNDSVVLMRYKVRVGDRVKAGDILADCSFSNNGVYCPGKNELVAYMPSGYNYEDAVHVSERTSVDFISVGAYEIKVARTDNSMLDTSGMFKYYKRGDQVATVTRTMGNREIQRTAVYADKGSGIFYNQRKTKSNGKRQYRLGILGMNKLQTGDKMSGRHGNKGVNSKVSPNSEMPMLANGTSIRMLLTPVGVPSRMNTGQIDEGHLGLIGYVLGIPMRSNAINGASPEELATMMEMTVELCNCGDTSLGYAIARRYGMPEYMCEKIQSNMESIVMWANTFDKNGDARLFNPVTGKWFPYKVTIGVSTMLKMCQEAETKIHTRAGGLEESYRVTTSQPPKGGDGGGQALGEMELLALLAHGAADTVYEMCHNRSDDETQRCNFELNAMNAEARVPEEFSCNRSVSNLIYMLETFGLVLEGTNGELPCVSRDISRQRYTYKLRDVAQNDGESEDTDSEDVMGIF